MEVMEERNRKYTYLVLRKQENNGIVPQHVENQRKVRGFCFTCFLYMNVEFT